MKSLVSLVLTLFAVAHSQGQSPFVPDTDSYGTAQFGCYFYGARDGAKVSGTNVSFSLTPYYSASANSGASPSVSAVIPTYVQIKIGTWTVCTDVGPFQVVGYTPQFKYASTAFTDGETIPVEVRITYQCLVNGSYVERTFVKTYSATSYQKLQTLGNNQQLINGVPQYNQIFETDSNGTTIAADSALSPPHTTLPGSTALTETKSSVLGKIRDHTVFIANTHGSASSIHDSDSSETIPFVGIQPTDDSIKKRSSEKAAAGIPNYNFAGIWACSTGDSALPEKFNMAFLAGSAAVAFDYDISLFVFTADEWTAYQSTGIPQFSKRLWHHAERVFELLAEGKTVEEAMATVEDEFVVVGTAMNQNNQFVPRPMKVYGDPRTRLVYVYLTPAERVSPNPLNVYSKNLDNPADGTK